MDEATFSFLRKASRQIGLSIAYLAAVKAEKPRIKRGCKSGAFASFA